MKIITLLLITACTSYARLGDTETQMVQRWGSPKMTSEEKTFAQGKYYTIGKNLHFTADDWRITALVIEGRCARITYAKPGDWDDGQKALVLTTNAQGAKWTRTPKPIIQTWRREDGATAELILNQFKLEHPAFIRAVEKAKSQGDSDASKRPNI